MTATADLAPIVADLELEVPDVPVVHGEGDGRSSVDAVLAQLAGGHMLLVLPGAPDDRALARLRDALWPAAHVTAVYRLDGRGAAVRHTLGNARPLDAALEGPPRTVLYVRDRDGALGRATTRAKFDANAGGWNGVPGTPTYGHYRWMRKLLSDVAGDKRGLRTLDAGCGAGWVGIEAALAGARASAFDPSPAMVEIAKQNAHSSGVALDARVGFVEDVPFADPFQLVLNSGVISFAPDADEYLAALDRLVEPGGLLVIGDLNPASSGFRRRRKRPLLPARELNGLRRSTVEGRLLERGYRIEGRWYYQITFPVPELMIVSEARFSGLGCGLALLANRAATALDHATGSFVERAFDSWILRARKRS
ncbi:MAG: methyltransferase domain-containing protein [Planctomycetes bacterium]|nr:methyltransferase domain-containing protein [Planctomycetota bacterium]